MAPKKTSINIILNIITFLVFAMMASSGSILAFILPPGAGRMLRGEADPFRGLRPEILGLTRHAWGRVHLVLAALLIVLVAVQLYRRRVELRAAVWGPVGRPLPQATRIGFISLLLVVVGILTIPWIASVEIEGFSVRPRRELFLEHWRGTGRMKPGESAEPTE